MNAKPLILLGLVVLAGGAVLLAAPKSSAASGPVVPPVAPDCSKLADDQGALEQKVIELLSAEPTDQDALCQAYNEWQIARSLAEDSGCTLPDTEVPDQPECEG